MIKVIIADDQELLRDLLEQMLKNYSDIEVAGCAANGLEAISLALLHKPDVVLMDIDMPECNGLEAAQEIKRACPETKILILTISKGGDDIREALDSGVDGYILKSVSPEELVMAIKGVYSNMEIIHKDIRTLAKARSEMLANRIGNKTRIVVNGISVELSDRELDVIKKIIEGKSSTEMASELFVTEGRLRNIITEVISKLMLKDRTQLAVFAIKNKLV